MQDIHLLPLITPTAPDPVICIHSREDFEQLFRTHYSDLCSYANGFLKDADASEDVVQEVMLRVWNSRRTIEMTGSHRSYLFRAVRNSCLNVLKHISIREQYKESKERLAPLTDAGDTLVASELQVKIREAVNHLPFERRKVFVLSRYDGLTYSQIAEKMGISVKTVENQMSKALQFLRKELADYLPLLFLLSTGFFRNN